MFYFFTLNPQYITSVDTNVWHAISMRLIDFEGAITICYTLQSLHVTWIAKVATTRMSFEIEFFQG